MNNKIKTPARPKSPKVKPAAEQEVLKQIEDLKITNTSLVKYKSLLLTGWRLLKSVSKLFK